MIRKTFFVAKLLWNILWMWKQNLTSKSINKSEKIRFGFLWRECYVFCLICVRVYVCIGEWMEFIFRFILTIIATIESARRRFVALTKNIINISMNISYISFRFIFSLSFYFFFVDEEIQYIDVFSVAAHIKAYNLEYSFYWTVIEIGGRWANGFRIIINFYDCGDGSGGIISWAILRLHGLAVCVRC